MSVRPNNSAAWWTGLLAAVLAIAAGIELSLGAPANWAVLGSGYSPLVVASIVAALFTIAEFALVHIEFRHEAYSFSLSGIPLVLGLLACPPSHLVAARVVGALVAFAVQRPSVGKVFYNSCAYAFEAASVAAIAHAVLPTSLRLDLRTALTVYVIIALVDVVMSLLVVTVISLHGSRLTAKEIQDVLLPAAIFSAATTGCGLIAALLLTTGPLGIFLCLAASIGGGTLYRGYLIRRGEHHSLALVHEFVDQGNGVHDLDEMASRLLDRLRTVLRATDIELVIATNPPTDSRTIRIRVGEDGRLVSRAAGPVSNDWLLLRVVTTNEPVLLARDCTDLGLRDWLATRGVPDAIVLPMPGAGDELVLVIAGRLGETTSFTPEDVTLARTLAGHLAMAMHGTRVVEQLRHDAHHDALTGLPNRTHLSEQLRTVFARTGPPVGAVLLLDLDRFKDVNDALGHHVGDELLRVVADRLRRAVPSSATVARLGGDEFAVFLPENLDPAASAFAVAQALAQALAEPIQLAEAAVSTAASIGIAMAAQGGSESDLLRHADTAMYAAKLAGKPVFYTGELDEGRAERLALLADLHIALESDELEVHYQPQLELETGNVVAAEALVRWRHPRLGLLNPDTFIPLAESTGLIHPLTDVVLRQALRQCRSWADAGLELSVAVNLSARSVDSGLPEKIGAALAEAGLPAHRLILEITESAVMNDPERAVAMLRRVTDIGVSLSLDDFGTGYSSLSYLQRLPVQEVKIDRSFVAGLSSTDSSHASESLIRSILTIGENLGLRVVAEGVEDEATLEALRRLGCGLAQGYHIGRPVPADQLIDQLGLQRPARTLGKPRQLRSVGNQ